ncbi:MAG: hypothetical protein IT223_04205, partial [Crocinitomicaceae bacterium]|nr:hypothetical protein [Crocinitomicaceae bacterium]
TAVYGVDAVCLINATLYTTATAPAFQNYYVGYAGAGIIVNGVNIPTQRIWNSPTSYPTTLYTYPDNTCNSSNNNVTRLSTSFDVAPNPNVLPQWLPAGTTLKTPTNKVFASVIEFDVQ